MCACSAALNCEKSMMAVTGFYVVVVWVDETESAGGGKIHGPNDAGVAGVPFASALPHLLLPDMLL